MNINEETWDAIRILMTESFWGLNSSYDSLIQNLAEEVEEFVQGCKKNDRKNSLEEAADVMMIILCILYKINANNKDFSIDDIMEAITSKLFRRYSHLYNKDLVSDQISDEEQIWQLAKRTEANLQFMYCNNKTCSSYGIVGGNNIIVNNGKFYCNKCSRLIISPKNSLLFSRSKKRKQYVDIINSYLLQYVRGDTSAPELFKTDAPEICQYLYQNIMISQDKQEIYINYVSRKFNLNPEDVENFLLDVFAENKYKKENTAIMDYIRREDLTMDQYPVNTARKLHSELGNLTMDVIKSIERVTKFNARNWNNQLVHKYLLRYDKESIDRIIECMTIIHYKDEDVRDLTIELSNMYNCIVGCKFCASGALPESVYVLEPIDYVRQLNTCIKESGVNPFEFKNFYVSFAGIGEPSVVYKNIAQGMRIIHDMYPHVRFNIATFGYDIACFEYWSEKSPFIRTLQIPFYSMNDLVLKDIVSNIPDNYSFLNVLTKAMDYKKNHNECRIKVNYIVMRDINDTDNDVNLLCEYLEPYRDQISIKVSYLNYTRPGEENNICSPGTNKLKSINNRFNNHGISSYIFGTSYNTEVGCGQLIQSHISSNG